MMKKYTFTCTCGHVFDAQANSREEAVSQMQGMMTDDAIKAHFTEKHAGQPVPSKAEMDQMIASGVKEEGGDAMAETGGQETVPPAAGDMSGGSMPSGDEDMGGTTPDGGGMTPTAGPDMPAAA